jgi:hypothetical protein
MHRRHRELHEHTKHVVQHLASIVGAVPPGGTCDDHSSAEILKCIAAFRERSLVRRAAVVPHKCTALRPRRS